MKPGRVGLLACPLFPDRAVAGQAGRPTLLFRSAVLFLLFASFAFAADSFRFVILGDRTGEAQPGVWEQVWRETAAGHPAFVVSVGDTIQGTSDATAAAQWQAVMRTLKPYAKIPLYLAPGNHDIWSALSARLFEKYSGHPTHYSFDYAAAHFTILDNSRSDELAPEELAFLEQDLKAHASQPLKFVISHRPSWIVPAALRSTDFPLHRLAKKYGVRYVIAGHIHQLIHIDLDGVTYLAMPSAGGHLRATKRYEDGWFFGHTLVTVRGADAKFEIKELKPPRGQGRVTGLADWGMLGLTRSLGLLIGGNAGEEAVGGYRAIDERSLIP